MTEMNVTTQTQTLTAESDIQNRTTKPMSEARIVLASLITQLGNECPCPSNLKINRPCIIEQTADRLVIAGLPPILTTELNNTAFSAICHDFQHLYLDGDFEGKQFIEAKQRAHKPLRNTNARIAFAYTLVYRDGLLVVKFMRNNIEKPICLHETTDEFVFENRISPQKIHRRGGKTYLAIPMTEGELCLYENIFSVQCAQEIQNHINRVYVKFLQDIIKEGDELDKEPDYYNVKALQKFYLSQRI